MNLVVDNTVEVNGNEKMDIRMVMVGCWRWPNSQVKEKSSSFDVSSLPFDKLLTTCDIALMVQDFLSQIPWYYAIIDEAKTLENPSSVCLRLIYSVTYIFAVATVC
ncbi:hypothetical protein Pint_06776 [Pistacia integerrima]|uniref:Uncharacterized protein n=1 Tax=Pistacia integerrima TaxID=434235 RepID=A0ACC0XU57_9ROSI|nr:hypothetical protein Pint_06776 [Pistacia integerrima]